MDDLIKREEAIKAIQELLVPIDGYEQHNQAVMSCMTEIFHLPSEKFTDLNRPLNQ